jgi:hypothetical protein
MGKMIQKEVILVNISADVIMKLPNMEHTSPVALCVCSEKSTESHVSTFMAVCATE